MGAPGPTGAEGDGGLPAVSVILATHNRAATLDAAIESVLDQTLADLELVVVDDASEDDTPQRLARWVERDARVKVLRNGENRGLPASLNRGISEARAPLLARIDDDDRWTDRDKLAAQLRWMRDHPDTVLLGTAYVDEWGRRTANPVEDGAIRRQMLSRCPFCHPSVVMRAETVRAVGGYDETLPYAEDWELWLRLGRVGGLANLASVTLVKARGDDTLSERYFQRQLAMASGFAKRFAADYPRAMRARAFHGFNRLFFRLVPAGGRLHRGMGRVFRRVFRQGEAGR